MSHHLGKTPYTDFVKVFTLFQTEFETLEGTSVSVPHFDKEGGKLDYGEVNSPL